jgi:hypothetical protein
LIGLPGADVIARAARIHVDERVYRLALTIDEKEIIIRCTDKNDPLALQEALEFFRIGDSDLIKLLGDPFTSALQENALPPGRFSNGIAGVSTHCKGAPETSSENNQDNVQSLRIQQFSIGFTSLIAGLTEMPANYSR